jgi:hypothetical protein
MADKDVTVTVSGNTISVSPDPVTLNRNQGLDKVKWTSNVALRSMSITPKAGGFTVQCTQKPNGTWTCNTSAFTGNGEWQYSVDVVTEAGQAIELDPTIIVRE